MTFTKNKNAEALGITNKYKRKYRVVEGNGDFKKGEIITLKRDDDSDCPWFWKEDKSGYYSIYWYRLEYAPKGFSKLGLSIGDIIVREDGDEANVLEVFENGFMKSYWYNFDDASAYYTFKEAIKEGWKIKGEEEEDEVKELTVKEISEKLGYEVKIIKE